MKSQFELMKRNPQYFVFKFLNFYKQTFSKVFTNSKENKLLAPSKSAYYFFFIWAKEYYNKSLLILVAKNKKTDKRHHAAAWICHAATCLEFSFFASPYHAAAWWSWEFDWSSSHVATWIFHVAACHLALPRIASFDSYQLFFAHFLIFLLGHHLHN